MRPRSCLLATALALAVLLPARTALCQGTSGTLPAPISSRDIDRYAGRLDLSAEQRQALDPFHEQYRELFRELRESDIEQYVQQVGGLWARGFRGGFDAEAIQESITRQERILSKIRLLDEGLFDNLQSVLTEDQVVQIPRIVKARERQRYQTGGTRMVGFANRASRVDLSRLYESLDLTAEEREATEPFVIQYENRLSALLKDLHAASNQVFLDVAEAMAQIRASFDDPNADRGQFFQTMRTAMTEAMAKPQEQAAEIGELNHASVRRINEFLSAEHAAAFRDRYLRRAYPEIPGAARSPAERAFQAVLNQSALPDGVRDDVSAAAGRFRADRGRIVNEMVQYIDNYRRTTMPFGRPRSARQEHDEKLESFRTRLTALDDATLDALYALVGPDLADTVRLAAASAAGEPQEAETGRAAGAGGRAADAEDAMRAFAAGRGPDPFLPQPITRRTLSDYRNRLGLADNDWFILESLHEDYVSTFNRIRATDIAALREAQTELAVTGDDENVEPPSPERIDEIYALRRRALAAILEADALFFDDIGTMLASPAQEAAAERLRLARQRDVYNRGLNEGGIQDLFGRRGRRGGRDGRSPFESPSLEAAVDLSGLVDEIDLDAQQRAETDRLLVEYEASAAEGFRRQYESVLTLRREVDKLRAANAREALAAQNDDDAERRRWRGRWQGFQELMEDEGRAAAEARKMMVELNRTTLDTIAEVLPDEVAQELRDAYGRHAFPAIYDDPRGAGRYLRAALALPDLGEQQRTRIEAVAEEYRPAHRAVAEQLAQIYAEQENAAAGGFDRSQRQRFAEQRNRIGVLEFDRTEINAKALRQLREMLTEKQQMQVRLPAEVVQSEDEDQRL